MKKKKWLLVIMVILILLLLITTVFLMLFKKGVLKDTNASHPVIGVTQNEKVKTLKSSNIEILINFSGNLPVSTVIANIKEVFVEEIPKVIDTVKDYSDEELSQYYDNRSNHIRTDLRIRTKDSFVNMVRKMRNVNCDLRKEYHSCDFYEEDDGVKFKFTYENGAEVDCGISGTNANTFLLDF